MRASENLAQCLAQPERLTAMDGQAITAIITAARAEKVLATLASRTQDLELPASVQAIFQDALSETESVQRIAMWEVDRLRHALRNLQVPIVLLKGSAFVAAGLNAAKGRQVGDLDILVPRAQLDAVETALLAAGWEWVKDDPYDQQYYRQHMHELPPMIHAERDGMIDVHHTILPLTAGPKPDAESLIAEALPLDDGLYILNPADMICHAAAHFSADGDMAGGMRNLWDVHVLVQRFESEPQFWNRLDARAQHHELYQPVARTMRMAKRLYGTAIDPRFDRPLSLLDKLFLRRITCRDGWGRERHSFTRFAVYIRSHWLRMPPLMLARHLWTKWRMGGRLWGNGKAS